jgi:hypothetical protein
MGFHCVRLLGACFFASSLFSVARSEICQLVPFYQCVMMTCWFLFNFAASNFGCCSLAQEMSFVDPYLPYFRHWFIIRPLSALLPFQSFFTESSHGDQLLASPPLCCIYSTPFPSAVRSLLIVLVFCFVFCFLLGGGRSVCPGAYTGIPWWLWEYHMMLVAHLLVWCMSPQ